MKNLIREKNNILTHNGNWIHLFLYNFIIRVYSYLLKIIYIFQQFYNKKIIIKLNSFTN